MAAGEGACSSPFSAFAQSSPRALPPLGHPPFVRNARTDCLSRGSPQTERLVGPSNPRNECLVAAAAGLSARAECFGLGRSQWTERFARLDPWIECSSVGWNLRTESFFRRKNLQTERFLVGRRNAPQAECLVGRNAAWTECRVGWSRSLLWMEPLAGKRRQTQPFVGRKLPMEPLLRKRSLRPHNCTIPPRPQLGSYEAAETPSLPPPPPRPKRIILVRHGQSEGNVDESVYCRVPDSKITLTEEGWHQALACGLRIRDIAESDGVDDWKVYFYVSPYKRTLQTLRGIGTAFKRNQIAGVREEPRIREQDFGNFQDREKMRLEKEARLRYGRFFYRFPNGESAADVYDRITGFRETLRADIDIGRFQRPEARSKNMNLVIVSHGLTLRVFLMRWYKWSVKQFEGLCNFENTGMLVMQLGSGGRYSLLVHHSPEELREFGLTKEMIEDQEWQTVSKVGELNYDWVTSGSSFFSHFNTDDFDLDELPPDIARNGNNSNYITLPPPCG